MSNFELNKIFAAVLVAGITAMLGGFVAEQLTHAEELEKDAVPIESAASTSTSNEEKKPEGAQPILHLIANADIARGQKLSKACAACHSFDKNGPNKVGPGLWGVVDAPKAGNSSYNYSKAFKALSGTWSYADLNKFLWKPRAYTPGTKMGYAGLKKPEDRAALIAWLRTLGSSSALPSAKEIAAE